MVKVTLEIPAPLYWRIQEVAEERYGVRSEQMIFMAILRSLRAPRGPQADPMTDWKVYQLWLRRLSTLAIANVLGVTRNSVYLRLRAFGLNSPYRDQTPGSGSKRNRATKSPVERRSEPAQQAI